MKAKEFDRRFDRGENVLKYVDTKKIRRPLKDPQRVNVDFPAWMVMSLDAEATRLGVTRQSVIKMWIADKLADAGRASKPSRAPKLARARNGKRMVKRGGR